MLGTNLATIADWGTSQPFTNIFKTSRTWITQNDSAFDTKEAHLLDLDQNGYPKSLIPKDNSTPKYKYVSGFILNAQPFYRPGNYVVLYDGEGTITYNFDAIKDTVNSTPGRDLIRVSGNRRGILVRITATDPKGTGNYIRNIRVCHVDDEPNLNTVRYNPLWSSKFFRFNTYRFMDWQMTNNSNLSKWSDRALANDYTFSSAKGVPLEAIIDFANYHKSNPWLCIPHLADNNFVEQMALLVKDRLHPDLKVYIEYSNECWNGIFAQANYCIAEGQKLFPQLDRNTAGWWFYSKKASETIKLFKSSFNTPSRVVGVMGGWFVGNNWFNETILRYPWSPTPLSHKETGIDAIAVAPYFSLRYNTTPEQQTAITNLANDSQGVDKVLQELEFGGVLSFGTPGGSLKFIENNLINCVNTAKKHGLRLIGYEGGQHLTPIGGTHMNDPKVNDLFANVNRHPKMQTLNEKFIDIWQTYNKDLICYFNECNPYSKFGYWGLLEHIYQPSTPKYTGLLTRL